MIMSGRGSGLRPVVAVVLALAWCQVATANAFACAASCARAADLLEAAAPAGTHGGAHAAGPSDGPATAVAGVHHGAGAGLGAAGRCGMIKVLSLLVVPTAAAPQPLVGLAQQDSAGRVPAAPPSFLPSCEPPPPRA